MCGIGGWFGGRPDAERLTKLRDALAHRGPDGEGTWEASEDAALVHTRLAILDLSPTGAQPMGWGGEGSSSRRQVRYWITFNGEIYNYEELRGELEAAGEKFAGRSDTEVLLRLFSREGPACLARLAGMFAFALWDDEAKEGWLARDLFGIKPLYYREGSGELLFASEWKALVEGADEPGSIDEEALRDFFLWGSVPEPRSLAAGIRELPAGGVLHWRAGECRMEQWGTVNFGGTEPAGGDPVRTTRLALEESVTRHLVSDVPVGIFLSGGIDSTALLALCRAVLGERADLRTFSIAFDDPAFDEGAVARRSAEKFGAIHTEWRMTSPEGAAEIEPYLAAMDQPTIDGFNTWCVSKLARKHGVSVVLSGLGGDELFAGYSSFRRVPQLDRLHRWLGPLRGLARGALRLLSTVGPRRRLAEFLAGPGGLLAAYQARRGVFTPPEARHLCAELFRLMPEEPDWEMHSAAGSRDAVSYLELTRYMRNQLLRDSDVFSMAHGLELRVPFVDARLFETLRTIPSRIRLQRGKELLLQAVPEIPEWVRSRPKQGFRFPFADWARSHLAGALDEAEAAVSLPLRDWYRKWAVLVARRTIERAHLQPRP